MEIKLPTSVQSERLLSKAHLPGSGLKLISKNENKVLLSYDTDRKIVYATDKLPDLERTKLYASYDYGDNWKLVYSSGQSIRKFKTLKSGAHLAWVSTGQIRRIAPDFSSHTDWFGDTVFQPLASDNGIADNGSGVIMFAEYSALAGASCDIFKSVDDGLSWTVTRAGTDVRHWHSVQVDPYTGNFWACGGDTAAESRIIMTANGGDTWSIVSQGSQASRAVGLAFTSEYVYWGMDTTVAPKVMKAKKSNFVLEVLADVPKNLSTLGIAKSIDGSIIGWTRVESTNVTGERDFAVVWVMQDDVIKYTQKFSLKPNAQGGFSIGSDVDNSNVIFLMGDGTMMDGTMGFVLPLTF